MHAPTYSFYNDILFDQSSTFDPKFKCMTFNSTFKRRFCPLDKGANFQKTPFF